jgi:hypothetical protein
MSKWLRSVGSVFAQASVAAVLAAAALQAVLAVPANAEGRNYALIVGINRYESLEEITACREDAEAIA